jgi:hypothetical protein
MPIDVTPGSIAALTIATLFWWTVLSPVGLLVVAVLCGRRERLRAVLTLVVLVPPLVTLLPVAVMGVGLARIAAAGAALLLCTAAGLALSSLAVARRASEPAERRATAAFVCGVAGCMLGSGALAGALLFT